MPSRHASSSSGTVRCWSTVRSGPESGLTTCGSVRGGLRPSRIPRAAQYGLLVFVTAASSRQDPRVGCEPEARVRPGRPRTDAAIRTLVSQMATANPLWRAPRIHGELGKLGIGVSERTVSRLLPRSRRPPSQTWRTFLTNHVAALISIGFFTVPTLTGRVLFVFVLLAHQRRRIVHVNVTEHPTAAWTAQQMIEAFPHATAPRWL